MMIRYLAVICLGVMFSGCTFKATTKATTDVFTDFSSSTFGGPWLTDEGLIRAEYRPIVFVTNNLESLQQDAAQGRGEHLTSLGSLLGISSDRQDEWRASVQDRYSALFPSGVISPAGFLAAIRPTTGTP